MAKNRAISIRKALRKRRIANAVYRNYDSQGNFYPYYNNLHQYSKNKIHCSCIFCNPKTRNKGKRRWKPGNYSYSLNYKASDKRKLDKLFYMEEENGLV